MSPFFSTILPSHNRAHLLGATLDSALAQEFDDNEIIVVDDGSTDETPALLANYAGRIRVLRQNQQGPGAARNLGIEHARGQYIAFLDSDDLWFPWTLGTYEQVIRAHGAPAFIAGTQVRFHDPHELTAVTKTAIQSSRFADFLATSGTFFEIIPGAVAVSADALRHVGGFTSLWINAEDSDLWLRLGTAKGFVRVSNPPLLGYRLHSASAMSDFRRTVDGKTYLIRREQESQYPGGVGRRRERLAIVTRHVRSTSIDCARCGDLQNAWSLYRRCFYWNLLLGRARYLLGFPLMAAIRLMTRRGRQSG